MKKLFMILVLVLLLCFTFSCQKAEEVAEESAESTQMTDEERASVAASVEQALSDYVEAMKQMDWNRMFQFYMEGNELVFAGDGMVISGKDTLIENLKERTGAIKEFTSMEEPQKYVYVLSRDAAVITHEFNQSYTLVTDEILRFRGSWIYVLKRINYEWKIVHFGGTHVPVSE
jgi:ketosteroid isomerase-like protein